MDEFVFGHTKCDEANHQSLLYHKGALRVILGPPMDGHLGVRDPNLGSKIPYVQKIVFSY